jgi:hypothetical protein
MGGGEANSLLSISSSNKLFLSRSSQARRTADMDGKAGINSNISAPEIVVWVVVLSVAHSHRKVCIAITSKDVLTSALHGYFCFS